MIKKIKIKKILILAGLIVNANLNASAEQLSARLMAVIFPILKNDLNVDFVSLIEDFIKRAPEALNSKCLANFYELNKRQDWHKLSWNNQHLQGNLKYQTPLQAVVSHFILWPRKRNLDVLKTLITNGSDVNVLDHNGETPILRIPATYDYKTYCWIPIVFELLLDHGARLDILNPESLEARINRYTKSRSRTTAKYLFDLIDEKTIKIPAKQILSSYLPTVLSDIIGEYVAVKDNYKKNLTDKEKEVLEEYA